MGQSNIDVVWRGEDGRTEHVTHGMDEFVQANIRAGYEAQLRRLEQLNNTLIEQNGGKQTDFRHEFYGSE